MRQDARTLLNRLELNEFDYRDFSDPFLTIEPWPLFEALVSDPRIIPKSTAQVSRPSSDSDRTAGRGAAEKQASIMAHYGKRPDQPPAPENTRNLRAFLTGLAERDI